MFTSADSNSLVFECHDLSHDILKYRRCDLGTIVDTRWIIDDDEHDILRIFRRAKADKGTDVLPFSIPRSFRVKTLGRTGLAGEIIRFKKSS